MANTVALNELLMPQVVIDLISKTRLGTGPMSRWLGFAPNSFNPDTVELSGPNTVSGDTRYVAWRIMDHPRTIMEARAPSTGPATVPRTPVGQVPLTCARYHEKVRLNYEEMGNLSLLVGPNSQIDEMGQDYISRQVTDLAIKGNNAIELMSAGMMRGGYYLKIVGGDRLYPMLTQPATGNYITVNFQVPAGNTLQLNMLGNGNIFNVSITNPNCPFIAILAQIKAAFAQLTGFALTDVWVNSIMWSYIITNNQVRQTAGTSETPFAQFDRVEDPGQYDGLPTNDYYCILRGDPTVRFHLTDYILITGADIDPIVSTAPATPVPTYDKIVPDTMMIFSTQPMPMWTKMYMGGEPVVERPGMNAVIRRGWYTWTEPVTQPSVIELISLLNAVPVLYNPLVVAPATAAY
jgi:hypothetical protein